MKLIYGSAFVVATALLAACGFNTRSQNFECGSNSDCNVWQTCQAGSCVVSGQQCHPACDSCDRGVCIMSCEGEGMCQDTVVCPPSQICRVICSGPGACGGGVDCTDATSCVVACRSRDTCAGLIDCGSAECDVACLAEGSCAGGVDCSDSCACTTNCNPAAGRTCVPDCPSNQCTSGPNCSPGPPGCNTCDG